MKKTTKYKIHYYLFSPVIVIAWFVCIIPIAIGTLFDGIMQSVIDYQQNRSLKLSKKYNVAVYVDAQGNRKLKEIRDNKQPLDNKII